MAIKWLAGILYRDGKVLIAKPKDRNLLIPRLDWTFPFIELKEGESPRIAAKRLFEIELSVGVKVGRFILKYIPSENPKVEILYYELKPLKSKGLVKSKQFSEFMWVDPTQVVKHFSTSISKELLDYLSVLEKTGDSLVY